MSSFGLSPMPLIEDFSFSRRDVLIMALIPPTVIDVFLVMSLRRFRPCTLVTGVDEDFPR
jgi:hypothetical protein